MPKAISVGHDILLNNHLRIFLLLCDLRNFSKVAQIIGVTQSSVSKTIANLENELGFTLFLRETRPLTLTPEARVLQRHLCAISSHTTEVLQTLQTQNFIKPALHIGIIESLAGFMAPSIAKAASTKFSRIFFLSQTSNVLIQSLFERKLDFIIVNDHFPELNSVSRRLLYEDPSVLLIPKALAKSRQSDWSWEDLFHCGLPFISYWRESGSGKLNETFLKSINMEFPERYVVDTNAVLLPLIAEGMGWTIGKTSLLLQAQSLFDRITALPAPKPNVSKRVYLIAKKDESECLVEEIASLCRNIIEKELFHQIKKIVPWVGDDLKILSESNN